MNAINVSGNKVIGDMNIHIFRYEYQFKVSE